MSNLDPSGKVPQSAENSARQNKFKKNAGINNQKFNRFKIPYRQNDFSPDNLPMVVRDGKILLVSEILFKATDTLKFINKIDKDGFSPLHYAVRFNHIKIAKLLIQYGANINLPGPKGASPLHIAARYRTGKLLGNSKIKTDDLNIYYNEMFKYIHKNLLDAEKHGLYDTFPFQQKKGNNFIRLVSAPKHALITQHATEDCEPFINNLLEESNEEIILSLMSPKSVYNNISEMSKFGETEKYKDFDKIYFEYEKCSMIFLLLVAGANVNGTDANNCTPLHYAAMRGNSLAVSELLSHPYIEIESKDNLWMTPLHYASEHNAIDIMLILIMYGANIRCLDKASMTPLHIACEEGHYELIKLLLKHVRLCEDYHPNTQSKVIYNLVNFNNKNMETPLHLASAEGRFRIVELLIEHGAEINMPSQSLLTPIHMACHAGSLECVKIFISKDQSTFEAKDVNGESCIHKAAKLKKNDILIYLIQNNCQVNVFDKDKETPLMIAAKFDHLASLKYLIENNANPYLKDLNDYNCLHHAVINNSVQCASYLLTMDGSNHRLTTDIDIYENTPLHLAAHYGFLEICKLILESSDMQKKINMNNDQGYTPILLAAKYGHSSIIELFLELSPSLIVDRDDVDNTALHIAAIEGHFKVTQVLLANGALVDSKNNEQITPLEYAIINNHLKVVKTILLYDPIIDPDDTIKISPVLLAAKMGHVEIVRMLIEAGSNVFRTDGTNRNILDISIDENQKEVVTLLLRYDFIFDLLRNCSRTAEKGYTTPTRKLIRKMPDVAEMVFEKCVTKNNLPDVHPRLEVTYNYEFLDDALTNWGSKLILSRKTKSSSLEDGFDTVSNAYLFNSSSGNMKGKKLGIFSKCFDFVSNSFKMKKKYDSYNSHPLNLMVKKERIILLTHPLVLSFLKNKWNQYGMLFYNVQLIFYAIFLFFLTGYSLNNHNLPIKPTIINSTIYSTCYVGPMIDMQKGFSSTLFISIGVIVLAVCCLLQIIIRMCLFFTHIHLVSFSEVFVFFSFVITLVYIYGSAHLFYLPQIPNYRCTNSFRSVGAVTMWICYMSFFVMLKRLPKIGIYVVMYYDILKTFLLFSPIYFLLVLTYGFSFYQVLNDRSEPNAFVTPFRSFGKTLLSTIGEIEYDTFYNDVASEPVPISFFILFAFIVTNTLILMNLLVGLAVDDIQGVQAKAVLKRLALLVDLSLGIEKLTPNFFKNKRILLEEKLKPNQRRNNFIWSLYDFKIDYKMFNKNKILDVQTIESNQNEIKTNIKIVKQRIRKLEGSVYKIESMLQEILEIHSSRSVLQE